MKALFFSIMVLALAALVYFGDWRQEALQTAQDLQMKTFEAGEQEGPTENELADLQLQAVTFGSKQQRLGTMNARGGLDLQRPVQFFMTEENSLRLREKPLASVVEASIDFQEKAKRNHGRLNKFWSFTGALDIFTRCRPYSFKSRSDRTLEHLLKFLVQMCKMIN